MHDSSIQSTQEPLRIILTGATGFVGEGVLLASLEHAAVAEVLMINRRHYPLKHPKLKELLVPDFSQMDGLVGELRGYDACFYCAGTSAAGKDENSYCHVTFEATLHMASPLAAHYPDMVFNFVSARNADNSGQGNVMWAWVKGMTENALQSLAFSGQYNFRPAYMKPSPGQNNVKLFYRLIARAHTLLFPRQSCSVHELGLAMINAAITGYPKPVLEVTDIRGLAGRSPKNHKTVMPVAAAY